MRIEINNESWYDLSDFSSYDEIEELGEITGTNGIPDCVDIEDDWDSIQEYLKLADEEQAIRLAYAEANSVFNWEEAQEAYVGSYADGAEFAESLCQEIGYIAKDLPSWIVNHIDWQEVWDCELHYDYFEQDGMYFRNL